MIKGIGIDIVDTTRFETVKNKDHFINQLFTPQELALAQRAKSRNRFFSVLFATKEALFKAYSIGLGLGSYWKNVNIRNTGTITISGVLSTLLKSPVHTYESHACSKRYACSVVLIER
jgi:phosphopantetheine--protein transferase-like protein